MIHFADFHNFLIYCSQVLSSYINPGDVVQSTESDDVDSIGFRDPNMICPLPILFLDLLQQSCLIPALCSYLRNDSGKMEKQRLINFNDLNLFLFLIQFSISHGTYHFTELSFNYFVHFHYPITCTNY